MFGEISQFIKDVGFPVAVATVLIFRMNGKLDAMTSALKELTRLNRATLRHTLRQHGRERGLDDHERGTLDELENGGL